MTWRAVCVSACNAHTPSRTLAPPILTAFTVRDTRVRCTVLSGHQTSLSLTRGDTVVTLKFVESTSLDRPVTHQRRHRHCRIDIAGQAGHRGYSIRNLPSCDVASRLRGPPSQHFTFNSFTQRARLPGQPGRTTAYPRTRPMRTTRKKKKGIVCMSY